MIIVGTGTSWNHRSRSGMKRSGMKKLIQVRPLSEEPIADIGIKFCLGILWTSSLQDASLDMSYQVLAFITRDNRSGFHANKPPTIEEPNCTADTQRSWHTSAEHPLPRDS